MKKGIIINNISNLYFIEDEENEKIYECNARGKLKTDEIVPTVGDNVEFEVVNGETGIITKVLERNTYIKRPKIANLTQILFVISAKSPKPDLLLLDKQLAFAEYNRIKPIIILNKTDLDNVDEIYKTYSDIGYTVIKTNFKDEKSLIEIEEYLINNISAFSGNSGVGKSTLINRILKKDMTKQGDISSKNQRGKNTTTNTKMYKIDKASYIADTPRIFYI